MNLGVTSALALALGGNVRLLVVVKFVKFAGIASAKSVIWRCLGLRGLF